MGFLSPSPGSDSHCTSIVLPCLWPRLLLWLLRVFTLARSPSQKRTTVLFSIFILQFLFWCTDSSTFYALCSCMWSSVMWLYLMRLFCTFLTALYSSLPKWAHCAALGLHCFLGKMPQASVQEMRGVGACRLKYLQWRHAMASFIRCLTSRTIKLSSALNQSQIMLFFFWHCCIKFSSCPGLCLYLKYPHPLGVCRLFELRT